MPKPIVPRAQLHQRQFCIHAARVHAMIAQSCPTFCCEIHFISLCDHMNIVQKTCASGIWKITTVGCDDGGDGTTTMCRRSDDDSSEARWPCAEGAMAIDRWHDNCMTTAWPQCDEGGTTVTNPGLTCHKPGFGSEPRPLTCHKLGFEAEPRLMTAVVVASSSCRRHAVVMPSVDRRRAVSTSSSGRCQVVVMLSSWRRRDIAPPSS